MLLLLLPLILNGVGISVGDPGLRIVGGKPVPITERPFQVVLYRSTQFGFVPDCGGAIINRRWVVTAAHCVHKVAPKSIIIRAGTDNIKDRNDTVLYEIEKVVSHEKFDENSQLTSNDIALLLTKKEFKYSPTIQSIKVRTKSPVASKEAIVSGFGVTKAGDSTMSSILREVAVTIINRKDCLKLLGQITKELKVSNSHFCAAYLDGGRDACQGDSGGPITIDDTLAGIVSWGIGCAEKMVPAFYTDVSQFVPWIQKNMKIHPKRSTESCDSRVFNETMDD